MTPYIYGYTYSQTKTPFHGTREAFTHQTFHLAWIPQSKNVILSKLKLKPLNKLIVSPHVLQ